MSSSNDSNYVSDGPSRRTRNAPMTRKEEEVNKFLGNFNPEQSEREKRKLNRRLVQPKSKHVFDEVGVHIATGSDHCDCLQQDCPGCHFPCHKCSSPKCGHECRNLRKWTYDSIENEGSQAVLRNPFVGK